jgi:hypothetical protein
VFAVRDLQSILERGTGRLKICFNPQFDLPHVGVLHQHAHLPISLPHHFSSNIYLAPPFIHQISSFIMSVGEEHQHRQGPRQWKDFYHILKVLGVKSLFLWFFGSFWIVSEQSAAALVRQGIVSEQWAVALVRQGIVSVQWAVALVRQGIVSVQLAAALVRQGFVWWGAERFYLLLIWCNKSGYCGNLCQRGKPRICAGFFPYFKRGLTRPRISLQFN